MFSSKNLRISPEVSGFMIGSGCSSFRRGKPPTDPKASGFVGGNPPPTVEVSVWAVFSLGSGGLVGYRVGWTILSHTHTTQLVNIQSNPGHHLLRNLSSYSFKYHLVSNFTLFYTMRNEAPQIHHLINFIRNTNM